MKSAVPWWTKESRSSRWFDGLDLDGQELIGLEYQQPKENTKVNTEGIAKADN